MFILNLLVIVVYLFRLVMYYKNIKRCFFKGICGDFFVEYLFRIFEIFCLVYILEILFLRYLILILEIIKKSFKFVNMKV